MSCKPAAVRKALTRMLDALRAGLATWLGSSQCAKAFARLATSFSRSLLPVQQDAETSKEI